MPKKRTRRGKCTTVTFKRRTKGGRVLPKSAWVTVQRCEGRKLRAHNKRQCRKGKAKTFKARQFVAC